VGLVIRAALSFGDTVERLLAAGLVIILGVTLAQHWNVLAILIALILFVLIRPTAVYLAPGDREDPFNSGSAWAGLGSVA